MKKILLFLVALVATLSMNAQTTEIYKDTTLQKTYLGADVTVSFGENSITVKQGEVKDSYKGSDYKVVSKELPPVSVTFVNPEGDVISTMPATQSIQKGSKASKPSDPTDNSGFHTLEGWYKTKDATTGELSDKWDFSNDVVTEDITLYAQWQTTIEKIIGKAAKPFPFDGTISDDGSKYKKDKNTWINGNDKIFYGAKYTDGKKSIFVRKTKEDGTTNSTQTYYTRKCLKTGSAYRYVSRSQGNTLGTFIFYIEDSVFTKMEYKGVEDWNKQFDGTYTPPTTTGTATATIGGKDVNVKWIQLWENGPKFAEYNVGVTDGKAESYGGYYCWGKTTDKDPQGAYKDGKSALTGKDDTATNLWGSNWRMPTQTELQGLIDSCDVAWTTVGGKNGCKFTGRGAYSSNSVFLPAAARCCKGSCDTPGGNGYYWSSTPAPDRDDGTKRAYHLDFYFYNQHVDQDVWNWPRLYSESVRAVLAK